MLVGRADQSGFLHPGAFTEVADEDFHVIVGVITQSRGSVSTLRAIALARLGFAPFGILLARHFFYSGIPHNRRRSKPTAYGLPGRLENM
jgi:hypothetical protein